MWINDYLLLILVCVQFIQVTASRKQPYALTQSPIWQNISPSPAYWLTASQINGNITTLNSLDLSDSRLTCLLACYTVDIVPGCLQPWLIVRQLLVPVSVLYFHWNTFSVSRSFLSSAYVMIQHTYQLVDFCLFFTVKILDTYHQHKYHSNTVTWFLMFSALCSLQLDILGG